MLHELRASSYLPVVMIRIRNWELECLVGTTSDWLYSKQIEDADVT